MKNAAEKIESIIESENMNLEKVKKIQFFIEKMTHSHAYKPIMMKLIVSLYLRRQNCYNTMKQELNFPYSNTINNYPETIDSTGESRKWEKTINFAFSKLFNEKKTIKYMLIRYI